MNANLLRGILERPEDTHARLVYADSLEEEGKYDRAEWIRVQCELAKYDAYHPRSELSHSHREWCVLKSREKALQMNTVFWGVDLPIPAMPYDRYCEWTRGFVSEITMPCAAFMEYAAAIFSQQPVTKVTLTDKRPFGTFRQAWFHPSVPGDGTYASIPEQVFTLLGGFDNRGAAASKVRWYKNVHEATNALSAACVSYGRTLAGLPTIYCTESEVIPD